jgi:hypothetical protein
MKKLMLLAVSTLFFSLLPEANAQDNDRNTTQEVKQGVKKGAREAKKGVKRGAHEVAEQASEAKSDITRTELDGKMGPNGEDIFIDKDGTYYHIDTKGHRVYITGSDLRDKPAKMEDD